MNLLSTSIKDYIELNYDIENIDINNINMVEELVINMYDYGMDIAPFYPEELLFFKNLKKCTFINFEITDNIIEVLNKLYLKELSFDNCTLNNKINLNIEKLYVEASIINFKTISNLKELVILECNEVNLKDINKDLKQLAILNTNIINSEELKKIDCNIEIIGCKIDKNEITQQKNIKYSPNEYNKI